MPFIVTRRGSKNLTYAKTRRKELWQPTRGVRSYIGQDTWLDTVRAVSLVLPKSAAFSHETALRIMGLPLPELIDDPLYVTREGGTVRRRGVRCYERKLDGDIEWWNNVPLTRPLRTWHDMAPRLELPDLVAIADVLLRRSLCTPEELNDLRGVRHRACLHKVAELADGGSWSPRESILRVAMHLKGLPKPELNGVVVEDGIAIGTADWLWREYRVIADYDGGHHDSRRQRHQDSQTRDDYRYYGWDHVPLTSRMGDDQAVERVARALRKRGWAG